MVGKVYVEQKFPPEAKENAKEMVSYIFKAFRNRIENLTWMSSENKRAENSSFRQAHPVLPDARTLETAPLQWQKPPPKS